MKLLRYYLLTSALAVAAIAVSPVAHAADPVNGKLLYNSVAPIACAVCHGADPTKNQSNILAGRNATTIRSAINSNAGGMGALSAVTDAQLQDIAAYIANPAAGNPSPAIGLSTTTLGFGSVVVGTTSPAMMVTVNNTGNAALTVSGVTVGGTNAADFSQTNNCSSVAPAASCTINVTFKPAVVGARSGSVSIAHNATGSPSAVSLTGTGAAAPTPAVGLSASSLAFGSVQVGTTSAAQSVTLTNTGTAALAISAVTLGGTNAGDFAKAGTCAAGSIAAGASCTISGTFTPTAAGARAASVTVASNAANSPHTVNFSGTGTAVPPAPVPVASITPATLSFGSVQVGVASAALKVTIANTGNAPLNVGAIALSGAQAADFSSAGCANTAVAAGANCVVSVTYKPAAAGASAASLSIAHNAAGSPGAVALSGTGAATPPTGTPGASFSPMSLSFGSQKLNMASAAQTVTLTNSGTAALTITSLTVSGANASEFALSSNTCTAGSSVAAGASCTAKVSFTPTAAGARAASLSLQSNAAGSHAVALSGTGVSDTNGLLELTQNGLVIDKIRLEDNGTHAHILLKNTSNQTIKVQKIHFTVGANYKIEDQCSGRSLRPGARCEIEIEYSGSKVGSSYEDKSDALNITTDTGASMTVALDLKAAGAVGTSTPTVAADGTTPKASGGCTIGGDDQADLSQLAMLIVAAGVLIARRRKASKR